MLGQVVGHGVVHHAADEGRSPGQAVELFHQCRVPLHDVAIRARSFGRASCRDERATDAIAGGICITCGVADEQEVPDAQDGWLPWEAQLGGLALSRRSQGLPDPRVGIA